MQISRARVRVLLRIGPFFQRKGMYFWGGYRVLGIGYRILDIGYRISGIGYRISVIGH